MHSGEFTLHYRVAAPPSHLRLPAPAPPIRADELWKHSCFEMFVRAAASGPYYEFNFSPSSEWSVYRFDAHRNGMRPVLTIGPPMIETRRARDEFELIAHVELKRLPELAGSAALQVGLSAIIEEADGRKSFWAIAHPPGPPDFHHSDCFALELAAPSGP